MRLFVLFCTLLTLMLATFIGTISTESISVEEAPYHVYIRLGASHLCSGSIISTRFVLTAGYCTNTTKRTSEENDTNVVSMIVSRSGSEHSIKREILHDEYHRIVGSKYGVNDIALLEVDPPFKFDESCAKITLSEGEAPAGSQAVVFGWEIAHKDKSGKNVYKSLARNVTVIERETCKKNVKKFTEMEENEICTSPIALNISHGFGGSPLVVNGSQVGIVLSLAKSKSEEEYVLLSTDVTKYKSWIKQYNI